MMKWKGAARRIPNGALEFSDAMRIARRPVAVDYITLIGLWIVWVTFLTSGTPYTPPSLYQDFRNPIHDARPVR